MSPSLIGAGIFFGSKGGNRFFCTIYFEIAEMKIETLAYLLIVSYILGMSFRVDKLERRIKEQSIKIEILEKK